MTHTTTVTLTGSTVTTSTTITESEPCPVTSTATCSAQRTLVKSVSTVQPSTAQEVDSNQISLFQEVKASSQNKPTVILGALLGLFVVVTVIIIVGWVWTYWNFKKRDKNVLKPAVGTAVQPHSQKAGNGQTCNVLNRNDDKSKIR